jgi:hypothetical protein
MKNYRKKQSIYILTSCHIFSEMSEIYYLINDLFERSSPEKCIVLRDKINKLISFVDKLPIYGKLDIKERKIKGSIFFKHKDFLIKELRYIDITIIKALSSGRDRILKGADVLDKINEIKSFIYYLQVYFYDNKAEKKMSNMYLNFYKELKKRERRKEF